MLPTICGRWWVLLLRGIAAILLGVCAIGWPGITLVALVYTFAAFSVIDGIVGLVIGFRGESDGTVWWTMVVLGLVAIAAGIIAFGWTGIALAAFVAVIAASAILRGVFEIVAAVRLRKEIDDEWILGLSGFMSILFGALILYRPDAGLIAIALLIGAYMIAVGILAVALSLRLRRMGTTGALRAKHA
jgi:uncharacterized membrane protein HdeD (DUF308 family)